MTIRRRLAAAYLVILALLLSRVAGYFWTDTHRSWDFENIQQTVSRQMLLTSIQQNLTGFQRQQDQDPRQWNEIAGQVKRVQALSHGAERPAIEEFAWMFEQSRTNRTIASQVTGQMLPRLISAETARVEEANKRFHDASTFTKGLNLVLFTITGIWAGWLAWIAWRFVSRRLDALTAGVDAFSGGNLGYRIPDLGSDELGAFAQTFNSLGANLQSAREELERRQQKLHQLAVDSEAASRAKSRFLANMSHELRTPINAIIGYSELLDEEAKDLGQTGFSRDLDRIRSSGRHLLALINDILDISKIEAGKMDVSLDWFSLRDATYEVVTTIHPLALKNSNKLEVDVPTDLGEIYSDVGKMRQMLMNLLSNSCKFTKDGTIRLEANRLEQDGRAWIEIRVTDTGMGMTQVEAARVFDAFTQADSSTTRKFGGTGLGLTIVRQFCELLGGTIRVESEPGKGSVFKMLLPRESDPPAKDSPGLLPLAQALSTGGGTGVHTS